MPINKSNILFSYCEKCNINFHSRKELKKHKHEVHSY